MYPTIRGGNRPTEAVGTHGRKPAQRLYSTFFDGGVGTEWTQANATVADETANFIRGSRAVKMTAATSTTARADHILSSPVDMSSFDIFTLLCHLSAASKTNLSQMTVLFGSDAGSWTNYYQAVIGTSTWSIADDVWNNLSCHRRTGAGAERFTATGTPDWSQIRRIRISLTANANGPCEIVFNELLVYPSTMDKGTVVWMFDDGFSSVHSYVKPVFDARGWKATLFQPGYMVDSGLAGYMTLAQVHDLHDNSGWDVAGHTYGHVDLTTVGEDRMRTELEREWAWLNDNGFEPVDMMAYPVGGYNATVMKVTGEYYSYARAVHNNSNSFFEPPNLPWPHRLKTAAMVSGVTPATVTGGIDVTATNKEILFIFGHNIASSGSELYPPADFDTIVNYVDGKVTAGTIQVMSVSELLSVIDPEALHRKF